MTEKNIMPEIKFKVFPKNGYLNSKYQVVTNQEEGLVTIHKSGELAFESKVQNLIKGGIKNLKDPGEYTVTFKNELGSLTQKIQVYDAYRYGTGKFKKAFVFDDSEYSFVLFNDRIFIHDEKSDNWYQENFISPTIIHEIDSSHYLFETKNKSGDSFVYSYAVYSVDTLSIVSELQGEISKVNLDIDEGNLCVFDHTTSSLLFYDVSLNSFSLTTKVDGVDRYLNCSEVELLLVEREHEILHLDTSGKLLRESNKDQKLMVDTNGYVYQLSNESIVVSHPVSGYKIEVNVGKPLFNIIDSSYWWAHECFLNKRFYLQDVLNSKAPISFTLNDSLAPFKYQIVVLADVIEGMYPAKGGVYLNVSHGKYKVRKSQQAYRSTGLVSQGIRSRAIVYYSKSEPENILESTSRIIIKKFSEHLMLAKYRLDYYLLDGASKRELKDVKQVSKFKHPKSKYEYAIIEYEKSFLIKDFWNNTSVIRGGKLLNKFYIEEQGVCWYTQRGFKEIRIHDFRTGKKYKRPSSIKSDMLYRMPFRHQDGSVMTHQGKAIIGAEGTVVTASTRSDKIVTKADSDIIIYARNKEKKKYYSTKLPVKVEHYTECSLSPDGNNMIVYDGGEYKMYDVDSQKLINNFKGNFIQYDEEGRLIIEDDKTRIAKIYDPQTLELLEVSDYDKAKFVSADGRLYINVSLQVDHYSVLDDKIISVSELRRLHNELNRAKDIFRESGIKNDFLRKCEQRLGIEVKEASDITYDHIYRTIKSVVLGINGTNFTKKIELSADIKYFNYAAFSYDNKYVALVGKPGMYGYVKIVEMNVDENNQSISFVGEWESRFPKMATWVCEFSKQGLLGTYDSTPNTYFVDIPDDSDINKLGMDSIKTLRSKSFLSFSPTGNYAILSEQGYEAISIGGIGHIESNSTFILDISSNQIVASFFDQGTNVRIDKSKHIRYCFMSDDETKLMTLTNDGVIHLRNLDLKEKA